MMSSMAELIITRGLPASGKTTWARQQVQRDPERTVRVERDELRRMTFGAPIGTPVQEKMITNLQHAMVREALSMGKTVIVSDTNLRSSAVRGLHKIAQEFAGRVQVRIVDFEVDVDECIRRDAKRESPVGEVVIRRMSQRYMRNGSTLPVLDPVFYERITAGTTVFYEEDESLPHAWLVDIDGTIADMTACGRGPYDFDRVDEDDPVEHVIELVHMLRREGYKIIIMSGREEWCREKTEMWLDVYLGEGTYEGPYMRASGDRRGDDIVKSELFEEHVRGKYYIRGVLDDRNRVVKMWREQKGLFVAHVADGPF